MKTMNYLPEEIITIKKSEYDRLLKYKQEYFRLLDIIINNFLKIFQFSISMDSLEELKSLKETIIKRKLNEK